MSNPDHVRCYLQDNGFICLERHIPNYNYSQDCPTVTVQRIYLSPDQVEDVLRFFVKALGKGKVQEIFEG